MMDGSTAKRVKAHRVVTLTMLLVALTGWGAFASASQSAGVARRAVEEANALRETERAMLLREQASALAVLHAQIGDLEQQLRLATTRFNEASPDVSETGGVLPSRSPSSPNSKAIRIKPRP
jgi:hypothetical protein